MKKIATYWPIFVLGIILYFVVDIHYDLMVKKHYPLNFPFMDARERSEYWQKEIDRLNNEQKDHDLNEGVPIPDVKVDLE
ncbi:MAG: hypothetical protein AAFQ68_24910 [Bacteroidota bacterium]